jgi:hypothetical protein
MVIVDALRIAAGTYTPKPPLRPAEKREMLSLERKIERYIPRPTTQG